MCLRVRAPPFQTHVPFYDPGSCLALKHAGTERQERTRKLLLNVASSSVFAASFLAMFGMECRQALAEVQSETRCPVIARAGA
eukprot:6184409-Pleurochrysis_carterae.AAC.4